MLNRLLVTSAVAVALGFGSAAEAQRSATSESQATEAQAATAGTKVHLEGCLYPERALSADKPVIVPSGSVEDYVLTDTKLISGAAGAGGAAGVYKVKDVAQDRMRALNGQRVGVVANVEEQAGASTLAVLSIREIVGPCRAVPTPRS